MCEIDDLFVRLFLHRSRLSQMLYGVAVPKIFTRGLFL